MCDLLLEESNVQPVSTPVTVCGDIHGQVNIRGTETLRQRTILRPVGKMQDGTKSSFKDAKRKNGIENKKRCVSEKQLS